MKNRKNFGINCDRKKNSNSQLVIPDISVIGGGSIGLLLSSFLSKKNKVLLLTRTSKQAKIINENGVLVSGVTKFFSKNVVAKKYVSKLLKGAKILFVCLKNYDTQKVLTEIKQNVSLRTLIVTCQNGLGNRELISNIFPKNKVVESIITFGGTKKMNFKVDLLGSGQILLPKNFRHKDMLNIKNPFIKISYVSNIKEHLWKKFIINCSINALGTITRLKNGDLVNKKSGTIELIKSLVKEAVVVARKYKIKVSDKVFNDVVKICNKTKNNINSMLQDIINGKGVTEIEFLNGKLLKLAAKNGLYLPANEMVYDLVKNIEHMNRKIYG